MLTPSRRFRLILGIALVLLLVPAMLMQFSASIDWTVFDFGVAAILLFGSGCLLEFILRRVQDIRYRLMLGILLLAVLFLIWLELAVGILGTPLAGS